MKKALLIAKEISRDHSQASENKRYKPILCRSIGSERQEIFSAKCVSGEISVEASNTLAATYAISQMRMGVLSGHLSEYLDEQKPLYDLRPLWIDCNKAVAISDKVGIHLPGFFLEKNKKTFESFCRRLLELGFNAVVFGSQDFSFREKSAVSFKELSLLQEMLSDYGIKMIVKPSIYYRADEKELFFLPQHELFREKVVEALADLKACVPSLDYLLWESCYLHTDYQRHPLGREFTKLEKVSSEVRLVEEALGNDIGLIFYLPCRDWQCAKVQSEWIPELLNEVGDKTTFAFSAVAGDPKEDHATPHPLWGQLRSEPVLAATPLLPILNSGAVGQGEGVWPGLTLDLVEDYYSRCMSGNFCGIMSLAGHIPREGSLADCNLWVAGQRMWRELSPYLLAQTWFEAKRRDIDFLKYLDLFKSIRTIIKGLSFLRSLNEEKNRDKFSSEECRLYAESLLAQLKFMECAVKRAGEAAVGGKTSLKTYIEFFLNDARRMIVHSLQCYNISINHAVEGEGVHEGIWTESSGGDGGRTVSQVVFFKEARRGEAGSRLHKLLWESRIDIDNM